MWNSLSPCPKPKAGQNGHKKRTPRNFFSREVSPLLMQRAKMVLRAMEECFYRWQMNDLNYSSLSGSSFGGVQCPQQIFPKQAYQTEEENDRVDGFMQRIIPLTNALSVFEASTTKNKERSGLLQWFRTKTDFGNPRHPDTNEPLLGVQTNIIRGSGCAFVLSRILGAVYDSLNDAARWGALNLLRNTNAAGCEYDYCRAVRGMNNRLLNCPDRAD